MFLSQNSTEFSIGESRRIVKETVYEEGRRANQTKRCGSNDKDQDISLNEWNGSHDGGSYKIKHFRLNIMWLKLYL